MEMHPSHYVEQIEDYRGRLNEYMKRELVKVHFQLINL